MKTGCKLKRIVIGAIGGLLGLASTQAMASASELFFDNASGLGNAYSGKAAIADDASTEYFNPAGLTRLKYQQFIIGNVEARYSGTFSGSDVYTIPPPVSTTIPQSGFVNGQPTYPPYPFIYYSRPVNEKITFGFGVLTPYGIGASIPDTSIVRYAGTRAIMYVIDFSPALAYKINNQLSAGLALDFQRLSYTTVAMSPSQTVGGPDARITNTATGWAYGWHGGVLFDFDSMTRGGLAFHSQYIFRPGGQSEYVYTPGGNVGNEIISNNFKFSMTLPPTTTLSLYRDINPQWAMMATADYSEWSNVSKTVFYNIAVPSSGNPSQVNAVVQQHYRNTWRFALGTNIKVNPKWMLRFGISTETDNTNPTYRSITDPGSANTSLAGGFRYQGTKTFWIDMGYQHYFMHASNINTVDGLNTENGREKLQRDALGLQATWDIV